MLTAMRSSCRVARLGEKAQIGLLLAAVGNLIFDLWHLACYFTGFHLVTYIYRQKWATFCQFQKNWQSRLIALQCVSLVGCISVIVIKLLKPKNFHTSFAVTISCVVTWNVKNITKPQLSPHCNQSADIF